MLGGIPTLGTTQYTLKNIKHLKNKLDEIITGNIASLNAKEFCYKE